MDEDWNPVCGYDYKVCSPAHHILLHHHREWGFQSLPLPLDNPLEISNAEQYWKLHLRRCSYIPLPYPSLYNHWGFHHLGKWASPSRPTCFERSPHRPPAQQAKSEREELVPSEAKKSAAPKAASPFLFFEEKIAHKCNMQSGPVSFLLRFSSEEWGNPHWRLNAASASKKVLPRISTLHFKRFNQ